MSRWERMLRASKRSWNNNPKEHAVSDCIIIVGTVVVLLIYGALIVSGL